MVEKMNEGRDEIMNEVRRKKRTTKNERE